MTRGCTTAISRLAAPIFIIALGAINAGCGGGGGSGPPAPSALSYQSPQIYTVGATITPLRPSVSGTVSEYSVAPALPAGLAISATTGEITGTPSAPQAAATYTITAKNGSGSATFALSISVRGVTAAAIARTYVTGTSVVIDLQIAPKSFSFTGTLYVNVTDTNAVIEPSVSATAVSGGYVLTLTTSAAKASGHYSGEVVLNLCSDASCSTHQPVSNVVVPYDIFVLDPSSAWPGNNLTALTAWNDVPDWTMFQGNAAHTGFVPVTVDPNQFSTRWQIGAPNVSNFLPTLQSELTTENGELFVSGNSDIYARKESDGSLIWQFDFGTPPFQTANPPAVANGVVYVVGGYNETVYLYAFRAAEGTAIFKSPFASQSVAYMAPTIGGTGIYLNGGYNGGIYGYSTDGQQLFFNDLGNTQVELWTPAVDESAVYVYTASVMQVLNPSDGRIVDTILDPTYQAGLNMINGSPVLGVPGSVFVANYGNSGVYGGAILGNAMTNFDVNRSALVWQIAGDYPTTPGYDAGVLYAVNNNPVRLEARSETDGTLLWWWTPPQAGDVNFVSEVLLTNDLVFVSTNLATYAIDRASHQVVWSYPLVGKLALSKNGVFYIVGSKWLAAFNLH